MGCRTARGRAVLPPPWRQSNQKIPVSTISCRRVGRSFTDFPSIWYGPQLPASAKRQLQLACDVRHTLSTSFRYGCLGGLMVVYRPLAFCVGLACATLASWADAAPPPTATAPRRTRARRRSRKAAKGGRRASARQTVAPRANSSSRSRYRPTPARSPPRPTSSGPRCRNSPVRCTDPQAFLRLRDSTTGLNSRSS